MVLKRTGRKYTLTHWWLLEEALWILTTLYFIFIHDALYFFRVFSGNSIVQWQNFIISFFPPQ